MRELSERILRDARRAVRRLRRDAATSGAAIVVVGLAVAAVAAAFSFAEMAFLQPLAGVAGQERLVNVHRRGVVSGELERFTWEEFEALEPAASLRGLAAHTDHGFVVDPGSPRREATDAGTAEPASAVGMFVSANYFSVLGTPLERGRGFLATEELPGAEPVAVVSHGLWQRVLGADPGILGRVLRVEGRAVTVVGVAPPGFSGPFLGFSFDLWMPVGVAPALAPDLDVRTGRLFEMVGRLAEGVGRPAAAAEIESLDAAQRAAARRPEAGAERWVIDVRPLTGIDDNLRGGVVALVAILASGALLLLAVSGLNVGGVLLARGVGRARETAIELALGAGPVGILRAHLVETLVLFAAGTALGVGGDYGATMLLRGFEPPFAMPLSLDIAPRPAALAVAILVTLGAGLWVGVLPARQALRRRSGVAAALQSGLRGTAAAAVSRTLRTVVALEVALSIVLLASAGLFVRSVGGARAIDPGFEMAGRWIFRAGPATAGLGAERRDAWFDGLVARLAGAPGVEAVGRTSRVPLGLGASPARVSFVASGGEPMDLEVDLSAIDAGYLEALAIPVVAGRNVGPQDPADGRPIALVNETLARRIAGGAAGARAADGTVGRTLTLDGVERAIVGVVRDSKVRRLWEAPRALVHLPVGQAPAPQLSIVLASALPRAEVAALVAREVRAFDPTVPRPAVLSLAERAAVSLLPQRLAGAVATALGLVCLLVAAAGLYGVFVFWVAARTQEIGVRRALGASDGALRRLVFGQCLRQLVAGAALGLPLALAAGYLLRGLLVGVAPFDPISLAGGVLVLAAATALAGWMPLRRALRVEPSDALRDA